MECGDWTEGAESSRSGRVVIASWESFNREVN
jgi:hypothetical protein